MNKLTLAMNAWRAYSAARKAEGSSLRGKIIAGVSVATVAAITLLRGDLTAADVSAITTGMFGLDVVLKYFIPDQLGQRQTDDLPPIDPIAESQPVRTDDDPRLCIGDSHSHPDRLPQQRALRPVHNTDEAADKEAADEHEQPGFNG